MPLSSRSIINLLVFVLIFGLISCSPDIQTRPNDSFKIHPPQFVASGKTIGWQEFKESGMTLHLADKIKFSGQLLSSRLTITSRCMYGQTGTVAGRVTWNQPDELKIFQLLPTEVFASFNDLNQIRSCDFEFVAHNVHGSQHHFQLVSQKLMGFAEGMDWDILVEGHKPLDKDEVIETEMYSRYWASPKVPAEDYQVSCQEFQTERVAIPHSRFSFAEVSWPRDFLKLSRRALIICRFLGFSSSGLVALSPVFKVKIHGKDIRPIENVFPSFNVGPQRKNINVARYRIKNPYSVAIRVESLPSKFLVEPVVAFLNPIAVTYAFSGTPKATLDLAPSPVGKGVRIQTLADRWLADIPPQEELDIIIRLPQRFHCVHKNQSSDFRSLGDPRVIGAFLNVTQHPFVRLWQLEPDHAPQFIEILPLWPVDKDYFWYPAEGEAGSPKPPPKRPGNLEVSCSNH